MAVVYWRWWTRAAATPKPTRTLSLVLLPALFLLAALDFAEVAALRAYGRPTAEVALIGGLTIQALETCAHGFAYVAPWKWTLSVLLHAALAPLYFGAAVTAAGLLVAAGVYLGGLVALAVALGRDGWPYGLPPLACLTLVVCVLGVRLDRLG